MCTSAWIALIGITGTKCSKEQWAVKDSYIEDPRLPGQHSADTGDPERVSEGNVTEVWEKQLWASAGWCDLGYCVSQYIFGSQACMSARQKLPLSQYFQPKLYLQEEISSFKMQQN